MSQSIRLVPVSITRDSLGHYHLRVSDKKGEVITGSLAEVMAEAYRDRFQAQR